MIIRNLIDRYGSVTQRVYKWKQTDPNGSVCFHFVHSQSYRPIKAHLVPNYHLAGYPLELSQVPLGVPGPQFGNHCYTEHDDSPWWDQYTGLLCGVPTLSANLDTAIAAPINVLGALRLSVWRPKIDRLTARERAAYCILGCSVAAEENITTT